MNIGSKVSYKNENYKIIFDYNNGQVEIQNEDFKYKVELVYKKELTYKNFPLSDQSNLVEKT